MQDLIGVQIHVGHSSSSSIQLEISNRMQFCGAKGSSKIHIWSNRCREINNNYYSLLKTECQFEGPTSKYYLQHVSLDCLPILRVKVNSMRLHRYVHALKCSPFENSVLYKEISWNIFTCIRTRFLVKFNCCCHQHFASVHHHFVLRWTTHDCSNISILFSNCFEPLWRSKTCLLTAHHEDDRSSLLLTLRVITLGVWGRSFFSP